MNILIIEDEYAALQRLEKILLKIEPSTKIVGTEDSIESVLEWFETHQQPDLIFMDIHVADGLSFEIFDKVVVKSPVIFTTAYDQYAIKAFKVNSIDYLLKPIKESELRQSIQKFNEQLTHLSATQIDYGKITKLLLEQQYQERIVVKYGQKIKTIEIKDAAYFYTADKVVFLCGFNAKAYPIDYNLDQIERLLNPKIFFRINRQFIININGIKEMFSYSKSRVKIALNPPSKYETIVSTERSSKFKQWLSGKI